MRDGSECRECQAARIIASRILSLLLQGYTQSSGSGAYIVAKQEDNYLLHVQSPQRLEIHECISYSRIE